MRTIVPSVFLAMAILPVNLTAVPTPRDEPTAQQLAAAKEAFAKRGAKYEYVADPITKQAFHLFRMPRKTTSDRDVTDLPDLPFRFALSLFDTKVTDAGLKELKNLKNIGFLNLGAANVSDAGLKELKDLMVTDAALKDLNESLPKCEIMK